MTDKRDTPPAETGRLKLQPRSEMQPYQSNPKVVAAEPAETKAGPKIKWPENYAFSGTFDSYNEKDWVLERALEVACNYLSQTGDWFPPLKTTVREVISDFDAWLKGTLAELQPAAPVSPPQRENDSWFNFGEVAPVSPEPPLRERIARALWNAEIAEEERKTGKNDWAQWPEDAASQPYCRSTYRIVDALLKEFSEAGTESARPEPRLTELRKLLREYLDKAPVSSAALSVRHLVGRALVIVEDWEASLPSPAPQDEERRCVKCSYRFRNHHSRSLKCPTFDGHLVSGWIDGSYFTEMASSPAQPVGSAEEDKEI